MAGKIAAPNDKATKRKFHHIGFLVKHRHDEAIKCLTKLLPYFTKGDDLSLYLESQKIKLPAAITKRIKLCSADDVAKHSELLISVGGDGTILRSARYLLRGESWEKSYLLGINVGHIGFLAFMGDTDAGQLISDVLEDPSSCWVQRRSCLGVNIKRKGKFHKRFDVLNDCVLNSGSLSRILDFSVEINGDFLSSYRADGFIVSTPTGSTAYNMAAGGSIIEPTAPIMQLTPICPQSFSNKPIVISDNNLVAMSLPPKSDKAFLTLDGQEGIEVGPDDKVEIFKSEKSIQFLTPPKLSASQYFSSLRQKLKWGLVSAAST